MGHAVWKLTSLVGISGLGFLILLQAQQGIEQSQAEAEMSGRSEEAQNQEANDDVRLASHSAEEDSNHSHAHLGESQARLSPSLVDGHEHEPPLSTNDESTEPEMPIAWQPEPVADHPLAQDEPVSLESNPADEMVPIAQRDPSASEMSAAAISTTAEFGAKPASFPETSRPSVAPASFESAPTPAPSVPENPKPTAPVESPATIAQEDELAPFRREPIPFKEINKDSITDEKLEAAAKPASEANDAAKPPTPDVTSNPFGGFGPPPGLMESAPEPTAKPETSAAPLENVEPEPAIEPLFPSPDAEAMLPSSNEELNSENEIPPLTPSPEKIAPEQPTTDGATASPMGSPFGSPLPVAGTGTEGSEPLDSFPEELPSAGVESLEAEPESTLAPRPLPEFKLNPSATPDSAPPAADSEPNNLAVEGSDTPASPPAGNNEPLFDPGLFQPEPDPQPKTDKPIQPELEPAAAKIDPFAAVMEQDPVVEEPSPPASPFGESPPGLESSKKPTIDGSASKPPADEITENTEPSEKPFAIKDDPFSTKPNPPAITPEPFATESDSPEPMPETLASEKEPTSPDSEPTFDDAAMDFGAPPAFSFGDIEGAEARPQPLAPADDAPAPFSAPNGNAKPKAEMPFVDLPAVPPSQPELASPETDVVAQPVDESAAVVDFPSIRPADATEKPLETQPDKLPVAREPRKAKLAIVKTAPNEAVIGKPVVYEIVVTNKGQRPAKNVTVADIVPEGAQLQGTIPQAKMKDDRLTWALGTLVPDDSATIQIKVVPTKSGSLGSVATVTFEAEVPGQTDVVSPKLKLSITAPKQVALGQPVDFHFEIANVGSATATNVVLRNILPAGFQHADGHDLEYDVGTLDPGAMESVTLRVATVKAGEFSNRAILTGDGGLKSEEQATVKISGQPLSLIRQGPQRRLVGRPAEYTNIVRNTSPATVPRATVVETIPAGMTFVRASQGGQYNPHTRTVAWQVGPLDPGEEATVALTLTATSEGTQKSLVRIEDAEGGPVEVATSTTVESITNLTPTIQGLDETILVGQRAAFRILLQNAGAAPARNVLVSLALPPQLRFLEARGGKVIPGPNGVTTVRSDTEIPAGDEHEIQFVVEAVAAGEAQLRTSIHAAQLGNPLVRDAELRVVAARS